MFYNQILEKYNIEQLEYCYNVNKASNSGSSIKANIPKIMPLVPTYDPDETVPPKVSVSDGVFINDSGCKISTQKIIRILNYLTIPGYRGIDLTHYDDGKKRIPRMTKLVCEIMSGNINKINLTDKL